MPDFRLRDEFSAFHEIPHSDLLSVWASIVESYSGLKLTRPGQDRLVALSGVADEFGRTLELREEEELVGGHGQGSVGGGSVYLAGLWLPLILGLLLWEKAGEEPHERLPAIPSYSWASVYTRVQWSSRINPCNGNVDGDCKVVNVLYAQSREGVASIDDPSFANGPPDYRPPKDGARKASANRFPVLCLRTKLQPVILGNRFQTQDDRDLAARLTEQIKSGPGRGSYNPNRRKVASYLDREHVAGWASLEHPEFQSDDQPSRVIFALQISKNFAKSAPGLGHRMGVHAVFYVLFVRRVEGGPIDSYERIGVGALFGKDFEKQFQTAVTREIRLL
ncbi:hypothetical protein B0T18DRAFT_185737 [Schizothecium vesticola]|uniref:Uncharacterized protein n=1 Tax=Schizothecium vesticola TaxID=314040 RepID=A0AA40EQ95_9PEZI|nr:hypothetical protein B0T18DRAFT_185737 [Schizothecium vesticola]